MVTKKLKGYVVEKEVSQQHEKNDNISAKTVLIH